MRALRSAIVVACAGFAATAAHADLTVTIENLNPGISSFYSPNWVAFHDGTFDSFDAGTSAALWPGITEIAEGGNTMPMSDRFATSPAGLAGGVQATMTAVAYLTDAPVLNPGERVVFTLDPGDRMVNRYFSYASMVVPSNDLFYANDDPVAHEIFAPDGTFSGPVVIEIRGAYDNGSEVNDAFGGAAFSANGGTSADESNDIRMFFSDPGDDDYLASFIGTDTVTGFTVDSAIGAGDLIARITIDFVPTSSCPADLDHDNAIDFDDLLRVLTDWGPCP